MRPLNRKTPVALTYTASPSDQVDSLCSRLNTAWTHRTLMPDISRVFRFLPVSEKCHELPSTAVSTCDISWPVRLSTTATPKESCTETWSRTTSLDSRIGGSLQALITPQELKGSFHIVRWWLTTRIGALPMHIFELNMSNVGEIYWTTCAPRPLVFSQEAATHRLGTRGVLPPWSRVQRSCQPLKLCNFFLLDSEAVHKQNCCVFESVEHTDAQCPFENRCARVCCCCDVIGIGGLSILQGSRASRHPALFFVRFVVNLSLIEWQNIEVLAVCTVLYPCCLSARSKEVFTSHSSLVCPSRLASLGLTTQWFKIPSSPPMKEAVLWKLLSPALPCFHTTADDFQSRQTKGFADKKCSTVCSGGFFVADGLICYSIHPSIRQAPIGAISNTKPL